MGRGGDHTGHEAERRNHSLHSMPSCSNCHCYRHGTLPAWKSQGPICFLQAPPRGPRPERVHSCSTIGRHVMNGGTVLPSVARPNRNQRVATNIIEIAEVSKIYDT